MVKKIYSLIFYWALKKSHPRSLVAVLQFTYLVCISLAFYMPVFTDNLKKPGSGRFGEKTVSAGDFSLEYRHLK